jgi:hypothetical protein
MIWCKSKSITIINRINVVLSSRCARSNCGIFMTRISGIARHTLSCRTTDWPRVQIFYRREAAPQYQTLQSLPPVKTWTEIWVWIPCPRLLLLCNLYFLFMSILQQISFFVPHTHGSCAIQLRYCSLHVLRKRVCLRLNCGVLHQVKRLGCPWA